METLKQYYDDEKVLNEMFDSVENPQWRVWKVADTDGVFRQNPKKINSIKRLREFLGDKPRLVYVSVAEFLQPQRCFGKHPKKAQWIIADTIFQKSDLLFDFDAGKLKDARKEALNILKLMKGETDYSLRNIRQTDRGYHLLYKDHKPVNEEHPLIRIKKTEERRAKLLKKLFKKARKKKIKLYIDDDHQNLIIDQFRVHAVIGSVKATTGHKVKQISEERFVCMKKCTTTRVVRPIKPMINDENLILTSKTGKERPTLSSKGQTEQASAHKPVPIHYPYYYHFISNKVKGIKDRCITVLKYPANKKVDIRKIQELYNLSHFFKFIYKDIQLYINFKIVSKEKLGKIMKYAKPMNLNSYMYYGHSWIPLTEAVDSKGNIVWKRPELVEIIKSKYGLNDTHSRPHANVLKLGFPKLAGANINRVCKAIIHEKEKETKKKGV